MALQSFDLGRTSLSVCAVKLRPNFDATVTSHLISSSILILSLYCPMQKKEQEFLVDLSECEKSRSFFIPFVSIVPCQTNGYNFIPVVSKPHFKKTRQHANDAMTDVFEYQYVLFWVPICRPCQDSRLVRRRSGGHAEDKESVKDGKTTGVITHESGTILGLRILSKCWLF